MRKKVSRIIFTNGVLDLLHPGHYNLLTTCRAFACRDGKVIVGIDTDLKAKKDKGNNRPYYSQEERKNNLLSLKYPLDSLLIPLVDEVIFFSSNEELYDIINAVEPDIIVKGKSWIGNVVGSDLAEVVLYDIQEGLSTSDIESRVISKNKRIGGFDPNI